jgi:hypothetical protein
VLSTRAAVQPASAEERAWQLPANELANSQRCLDQRAMDRKGREGGWPAVLELAEIFGCTRSFARSQKGDLAGKGAKRFW